MMTAPELVSKYYARLRAANTMYAAAKAAKAGVDIRYMAPEMLPSITSDQVKAIVFAEVSDGVDMPTCLQAAKMIVEAS